MRTSRLMMAMAAMLCLHSTVHASLSASSSLSNMRFSLVDLDTSDGVTPWMQITPVAGTPWGDGSTMRLMLADYTQPGWNVRITQPTSGDYASGSVSATAGNTWGSSRIAGGSGAQDMGYATDMKVDFDPSHPKPGIAHTGSQDRWEVTLSPNTQLVWTADYDIAISADIIGRRDYDEFLQASASLTIDEGGDRSSSDTGSIWFDDAQSPGHHSNHLAGELSTWVSNTGTSERTVSLEPGAYLRGWLLATPVPEPGSMALLAAGLPWLACIARKRRKAA